MYTLIQIETQTNNIINDCFNENVNILLENEIVCDIILNTMILTNNKYVLEIDEKITYNEIIVSVLKTKNKYEDKLLKNKIEEYL